MRKLAPYDRPDGKQLLDDPNGRVRLEVDCALLSDSAYHLQALEVLEVSLTDASLCQRRTALEMLATFGGQSAPILMTCKNLVSLDRYSELQTSMNQCIARLVYGCSSPMRLRNPRTIRPWTSRARP